MFKKTLVTLVMTLGAAATTARAQEPSADELAKLVIAPGIAAQEYVTLCSARVPENLVDMETGVAMVLMMNQVGCAMLTSGAMEGHLTSYIGAELDEQPWCSVGDLSVVRVVSLVKSYLRKNPKLKGSAASSVIILVLRDAFKCPQPKGNDKPSRPSTSRPRDSMST